MNTQIGFILLIFLFFLITVLIVVLLSFLHHLLFNNKVEVKTKLKNANYKKIAHFKNEEVTKIVGNVEFIDKSLVAPLSKCLCSYYHIKVEQYFYFSENTNWKTISEEEDSIKFLIKDGINYALINCENLKSYIVKGKNYSSGFLNNATDGLGAFLNSKNYESKGLFGFNKKIRCKEYILEEGEEIAVYGKGVWKEANELNLPDENWTT